jgi:hypothetical protein
MTKYCFVKFKGFFFSPCTVLKCVGRAKLILRFICKYKYPDWVMSQLQVTAAIDAALQMGYSPLKVRLLLLSFSSLY